MKRISVAIRDQSRLNANFMQRNIHYHVVRAEYLIKYVEERKLGTVSQNLTPSAEFAGAKSIFTCPTGSSSTAPSSRRNS
jgi:hypothetical protein